MIESILIADTATYSSTPEHLCDLSTFNFIFGGNATGKTTISRVIADQHCFPSCVVNWKSGTLLQSMVYNRDFIETNFNQSQELKGVFTLGEKNVETINKIEAAKTELDKIANSIETLTHSLQGEDGTGGKKGELAVLEAEIKNKCWAQKQKHDAKFQGAFEGFRNSAERFKDKIFQEWVANSANLETLSELEKKAETVFGPTPTAEKIIPSLDIDSILAHESDPILKKRVIGKEDINVAAMIKKLGNSDWVREGRDFYDANEGVCPFCQQPTNETFVRSLNDYFDEAFETDSKAIEDLFTNYRTNSSRLQQQVSSIIADPTKFIDIEKLRIEKDLFYSTVTVNLQKLSVKKKEPSQFIELQSLSNVFSAIKAMIDTSNDLAVKHNKIVANLSLEQSNLTVQVWKFLVEVELRVDLDSYKTKRDTLKKAIDGITKKIAIETEKKKTTAADIRELEKLTTSIQPTIDGINLLLSTFGFQSFLLAEADDRKNYKLVRYDGTDAKETLSEGEKNFVTFLYFYYSLKGSDTDSGMTVDRVVVIDDPVSSLDSDIVFIVSSLIKALFNEVRDRRGYVKQVFVLTHNVYFHKEVTYNPKRCEMAMAEETFWVVRKSGSVSKIEKHNCNPVRTSYELLWGEVRKPDHSNLTIQNTLRRILENYFKILGGVDPDSICELFEGKEKLICKSLFSWVNEGSHYAHDDLYLSVDDAMVDAYLRVFRAIFEKSNHLAHYEMMMGRT